MTGIFISYRRLESKLQARILFERLEPRFPGRVFMDVDGLKPGENFRDTIGAQLERCTVLLALIGPQWEAVRDGKGNRRLDDPRDWVRLEIATALQRGITVVPVLIERAHMPAEQDLPEDLRRMLDRHAFVLNLDQGFGQGMRDLVEAIRPDMGRGVSIPDWVKWAVPALGLVASGGYLAMNPPKWLESAPKPAAVAAPAPPPDPFPAKKIFRDCEDAACPWMVVIPAGNFLMGSPESEPGRNSNEGPQHRVSVTKFAMGQFEVTQGQWAALMGSNPSRFQDCGDECPVERVSWDDAQEYVKRLSEKTGKKYRLPSEEEWEYSARAGTITTYAFGTTLSTSQANFGGTIDKTVKVGNYAANNFGLSDMHGNVWEWVQDCDSNLYGIPLDGFLKIIGLCKLGTRILRGGAWNYSSSYARAASRYGNSPLNRYSYTGFRLARTLTP